MAAAIFVVRRGTRTSYAATFFVALSALGAVLLYRYVNVLALGPLPAMYEPVWFFEKTLSAVAEAIAVVVAGAALLSMPGAIVPRRRAHTTLTRNGLSGVPLAICSCDRGSRPTFVWPLTCQGAQ